MNGGRIIGLYGYPGSGKDSVAKCLVDQGGWVRVAFADPIKEILLALDPYVEVDDEVLGIVRLTTAIAYYGTLEEVKRQSRDTRRLLQRLGTEAGRDILGQDTWVNAAKCRIFDAVHGGMNVVVTDMRFPNEYRTLCGMGATIAEIKRPRSEAMDHASEQNYGDFIPNYIIHNDGTLADLHDAVDALLTDCHETAT